MFSAHTLFGGSMPSSLNILSTQRGLDVLAVRGLENVADRHAVDTAGPA